jgi:hypothetical protein
VDEDPERDLAETMLRQAIHWYVENDYAEAVVALAAEMTIEEVEAHYGLLEASQTKTAEGCRR